MSDALLILVAANLAAAAAVALVMILRMPARRLFGPRIAYGLWLLVPLAALGILLPSRVVTVTVRAASDLAADASPIAAQGAALPTPAAAPFDPWLLGMGLWIAGALASLAWMAWRQAQFGRDAEAGLAGPAVVGVLRPRVITPSDFGRRYSPREQFVVLAHEETHIVRHDTRINALVAAARCVNWFNPMLYVLARALRVDQELACDAQVIARHPKVRRSYAEAMLKTQLAARPLPLGCYWLAAEAHPLAERVRLLSRRAPAPHEQALGLTVLAALAALCLGAPWAAKPARVQVIELPAIPRLSAAPPASGLVADTPGRVASPSKPTPLDAAFPLPAEPLADPAVAAAEAQADALAAPALPEAEGVRNAVERAPRLARERRVYAVANRSSVEPGSAVRVVATAFDPEGRPLMADLTSFGSQHYYRTGSYANSGSRQGVYTSVVQRGDRLWVTVSLNRRFQGAEVGTIEMRSGETRTFALPNGQMVTVAPTLRPETADEAAGVHEVLRRVDADLDRSSRDAWNTFRQRCRGETCAGI